ncbi:hypothetical protein [Mucilaginibacter paludis]|uniref:Uncharacterized protein n=1 Tax=Mucilaginibacter paludis DSM 18603 TaxID=714943 RepID=H1Y388_9SPHI|nr:hypothetical protein [Mucilaginibacter paludis]EHQ29243.1 hypothetical protein Mucpa_5168 [Mucilaginibacter paludis DSM 18603]
MINYNSPIENEEADASRNDVTGYGDDTIGENTGDSALAIESAKSQAFTQEKKPSDDFDPRVETVVPDNDN